MSNTTRLCLFYVIYHLSYLAGMLCTECILNVSDPSLPYPLGCCSCIASNLNRSLADRGSRECFANTCAAIILLYNIICPTVNKPIRLGKNKMTHRNCNLAVDLQLVDDHLPHLQSMVLVVNFDCMFVHLLN